MDTYAPSGGHSRQDFRRVGDSARGRKLPCGGDPPTSRTGRARAAHRSYAPSRRVAPTEWHGGHHAPLGTARAGTVTTVPTLASAATSGGIEPSPPSSRTASARSAIGAVRCTSRIRTSTAATTAQAKASASCRRAALTWSHLRDDGPQVEPRPPRTSARPAGQHQSSRRVKRSRWSCGGWRHCSQAQGGRRTLPRIDRMRRLRCGGLSLQSDLR